MVPSNPRSDPGPELVGRNTTGLSGDEVSLALIQVDINIYCIYTRCHEHISVSNKKELKFQYPVLHQEEGAVFSLSL